jgi:hypothetical protein
VVLSKLFRVGDVVVQCHQLPDVCKHSGACRAPLAPDRWMHLLPAAGQLGAERPLFFFVAVMVVKEKACEGEAPEHLEQFAHEFVAAHAAAAGSRSEVEAERVQAGAGGRSASPSRSALAAEPPAACAAIYDAVYAWPEHFAAEGASIQVTVKMYDLGDVHQAAMLLVLAATADADADASRDSCVKLAVELQQNRIHATMSQGSMSHGHAMSPTWHMGTHELSAQATSRDAERANANTDAVDDKPNASELLEVKLCLGISQDGREVSGFVCHQNGTWSLVAKAAWLMPGSWVGGGGAGGAVSKISIRLSAVGRVGGGGGEVLFDGLKLGRAGGEERVGLWGVDEDGSSSHIYPHEVFRSRSQAAEYIYIHTYTHTHTYIYICMYIYIYIYIRICIGISE